MSIQINQLKLKSITTLFKESFKLLYLKRKVLIGIMIIPVAFSLTDWLLEEFWLKNFDLRIFWEIWPFILFFLFLITAPAFIYVLKEDAGVKQSFQKAFQILFPYFWIFVLLTFIITGGFILFIIPGILFTIWFSLTFYVLIFEQKQGISALFQSQELISGKFWQALWRFFVFGLIFFIIPAVAAVGFEAAEIDVGHNITLFVRLFSIPLSLVYGFLIYQNLKEIKPETSLIIPSLKRKLKYAIPAVLGLVIWTYFIAYTIYGFFTPYFF